MVSEIEAITSPFSYHIKKRQFTQVFSFYFYHLNDRKLHDPIYCIDIASNYRNSLLENL